MTRNSFIILIIFLVLMLLTISGIAQRQEQALLTANQQVMAQEILFNYDLTTEDRLRALPIYVASIADADEPQALAGLVRVTQELAAEGDLKLDEQTRWRLSAWGRRAMRRRPLQGTEVQHLIDLWTLFGYDEAAADLRTSWSALRVVARARLGEIQTTIAALDDVHGAVTSSDQLAALGRAVRQAVDQFQTEGLAAAEDPELREMALDSWQRVWSHTRVLLAPYRRLLESGGTLSSVDALSRRQPERAEAVAAANAVLEELANFDFSAPPDDADLLALISLAPGASVTAYAVLTLLLLLPSSLLVLAIRWVSSGPGPIDPAAETLENVEPIDLDTEAITIGEPTTNDATSHEEEAIDQV